MSDDWQPGDLAMIVRGGRLRCPHTVGVTHIGSEVPPVGSVRIVVNVRPSPLRSGRRCGCVDLRFSDGKGAVAQRCKKLRPHQPDAEDAETIALLKGGRVPA